MGNGKRTAQRADQLNTVKNLSSNMNAIKAVKNEPALTILQAAFAPELLSPADLPVLQQSFGNRAVQRMLVTNDVHDAGMAKLKENLTGMPDQLKARLECLSGLDLANVRVHYNSDQPHQVGALAYTQGTDIYVAPGQEKHLPHEGWHVVQQLQGRVGPTGLIRGQTVNNNPLLEEEAERAAKSTDVKDVGTLDAGPYALNKVIQKKPSEIENFEQTFKGSIGELEVKMAKYQPLVDLFNEQFPGRNFGLLFGLFGITTLGEIQEALKDSNPNIAITVIKTGDTLTVNVENSYLDPLYNVLEMQSDPPILKLYKWEARRTEVSSDVARIPKGVGCWVFEGVRKSASMLGINEIIADAIGHPQTGLNPEVGYYVWPRFGFNQDLNNFNEFWSALLFLDKEQKSGLKEKIENRELLLEKLSGSKIPTMGKAEKQEYYNTFKNQLYDENLNNEIQYLELDFEIDKVQTMLSKHALALNWVTTNVGQLKSLNDLFLLPQDLQTRLAVAALWKDFGETVMSANFDLTENSRSNQIFRVYREAEFNQRTLARESQSIKEITNIETLRRLYGLI